MESFQNSTPQVPQTYPGGSWWPLDEARDDKEVADGPHPRCPPSVKGGIFLYLSVGCQGQPGLRSSVVTQILWDLLNQPQPVISGPFSSSVLSVGDECGGWCWLLCWLQQQAQVCMPGSVQGSAALASYGGRQGLSLRDREGARAGCEDG